MATITPLLTAADYWQLPDSPLSRELVRGEVRETMPPGGKHGDLALELGSRLRTWAKSQKAGNVGTEAGFRLAADPDTVRSPDVYYVRQERIPQSGIPEGFWNLSPDLAVEIISPTETAQDIRDKVDDYLRAGTLQVWLVFPKTQSVEIHTPDGHARILRVTNTLTASDLFPGFTCPLAELFAA